MDQDAVSFSLHIKFPFFLIKYLIEFICFNCEALKKTYTNECLSSYQCDDAAGLICPVITGTCNCPVVSTTIFCDCTRLQQNESYWNGSSCEMTKAYNQPCLNASSSYMCQTLTQGTICNGTWKMENFSCQCPYLKYFDMSLSKCQDQVSYNVTCSYNERCLTVNGLACLSGICE